MAVDVHAHSLLWNNLPLTEVLPGLRARFIHTNTMTLALWEIDAGADLPAHAHENEQISHVISGEFELIIDGISHHLTAGMVAVIPAHATHSGIAKTACEILDCFSPPRLDYQRP